jgi:hypothetical protein
MIQEKRGGNRFNLKKDSSVMLGMTIRIFVISNEVRNLSEPSDV